jgi:hypothetical protein
VVQEVACLAKKHVALSSTSNTAKKKKERTVLFENVMMKPIKKCTKKVLRKDAL